MVVENPMKQYGDAHRMFVQAMMSKGIVTGADISNLFKLCCKKGKIRISDDPASDKKDFLICINSKLSKVNMRLKNISDEVDRDKKSFLALVNLSDRSMDQSQLTVKAMVTFAPFEIEFLKILVEGIMANPAKQIGQTNALNISRQVKTKKMDVVGAEQVLQKLLKHKWIISNHDKLRFHPRFIAEMEPWLTQVYADQVNTCDACKKLVIKGLKCPNQECDAIYHLHCIFDRKVRNRGLCPRCNTDMTEEKNITLRQAADADANHPDYAQAGPSQGGKETGSKKRKRSRILANNSSDESD